jgi:hypothetical protein
MCQLKGSALRVKRIDFSRLLLSFVKTYLRHVNGTKNMYAATEREMNLLSWISIFSDAFETGGWHGLKEFLAAGQNPLAWCSSPEAAKVLEIVANQKLDIRTATVAKLLENDEEFNHEYHSDSISHRTELCKNFLDYIENAPSFARPTVQLPLDGKEAPANIRRKRAPGMHRQLAEKYGRILEIRKSDSYKCFICSDPKTMKWEGKYVYSSMEFIEKNLELVNTHRSRSGSTHRVFRVRDEELAAIDAFVCVSREYEKGGWQAVTDKYLSIKRLLRSPFSNVEELSHVYWMCDSGIFNPVVREMLRTGKGWKEASEFLKIHNQTFKKKWQDVEANIREKIRCMKPLLPYIQKYLQKVRR